MAASSSSPSSAAATPLTAADSSNLNAANVEPKEVTGGSPLPFRENVPVACGPHVRPPAPLPPQPTPTQPLYVHEQIFDRPVRYQPPGPVRDVIFRAVAWGLLISLITCLSWFFIWLIIQPTSPQLHVSSGVISQISTTNNTATASCNITLSLINPNSHFAAVYYQMEVSLLYPSQRLVLSQDYLPPLVQPRKNQTVISTDLGFTNLEIGKDVVEAIKGDLRQGTVTLGVKVLAVVYFQNGKWKTRSQIMKGFCGGLGLVSLPNNKSRIVSLNPYYNCVVYLYQD